MLTDAQVLFLASRLRRVFEAPETQDVNFYRQAFDEFWAQYMKGLTVYLQVDSKAKRAQEMKWSRRRSRRARRFSCNRQLVLDALGTEDLALQLAGIPVEFLYCLRSSHGVREDWDLDMDVYYTDITARLVEGLCDLGLDATLIASMRTMRCMWMKAVARAGFCA